MSIWSHGAEGNVLEFDPDARLVSIGATGVYPEIQLPGPGGFGPDGGGIVGIAAMPTLGHPELMEWWRVGGEEPELVLSTEFGPALPEGGIPWTRWVDFEELRTNGRGDVAWLTEVAVPGEGWGYEAVVRVSGGKVDLPAPYGTPLPGGRVLERHQSQGIGLGAEGEVYAVMSVSTWPPPPPKGLVIRVSADPEEEVAVLGEASFGRFFGARPSIGTYAWLGAPEWGLYHLTPDSARLVVGWDDLPARGGMSNGTRVNGVVLGGDEPALLIGTAAGQNVIWRAADGGFETVVETGDEVLIDGVPRLIDPGSAVLGSDGSILFQNLLSAGPWEILRFKGGTFSRVLSVGGEITLSGGDVGVVETIGAWGEPIAGDEAVVFVTLADRREALLALRVSPDCGADFDGSGAADVNDLLGYLGAFRSGDPAADLDGDGAVGVSDLLAFLGAFRAGC